MVPLWHQAPKDHSYQGFRDLIPEWYYTWSLRGYTVEAQKLETQQPQSLRVMHRESQHYLALIRFPAFWGLLYCLIKGFVGIWSLQVTHNKEYMGTMVYPRGSTVYCLIKGFWKVWVMEFIVVVTNMYQQAKMFKDHLMATLTQISSLN